MTMYTKEQVSQIISAYEEAINQIIEVNRNGRKETETIWKEYSRGTSKITEAIWGGVSVSFMWLIVIILWHLV